MKNIVDRIIKVTLLHRGRRLTAHSSTRIESWKNHVLTEKMFFRDDLLQYIVYIQKKYGIATTEE
jgi:hypothetical protein